MKLQGAHLYMNSEQMCGHVSITDIRKTEYSWSPHMAHLSMLDLVSAILLRLETLKPYALPLWPLFMKLPKASTTSRI